MTAQAYEQLLVVQDLDLTLLQLRHKAANHELAAAIVGVEEELASTELIAAEISERKTVLETAQEVLDTDVESIKTRRAEIEVKLYDGSVTGTKDLLALQDEAKTISQRQSEIEDDELEIMEQIESVETELEPVTETIRGHIVTRGEHQAALEKALAEIGNEIERLDGERTTASSSIQSELLATYDALREDLGGVAVARLVGSTCDGCHMSLSAVAFDRIKRLDDDAVMNCDQCGRLLIR